MKILSQDFTASMASLIIILGAGLVGIGIELKSITFGLIGTMTVMVIMLAYLNGHIKYKDGNY